ncbi:MAG: flagellar biosynthetic protein FliR [Paracoccaceae bacterium]
MTDLLAGLLALTEGMLPTAFAVFLRVGAAMALIPGFGEQVIPLRLRLGMTLAFTAVVFPAVAPEMRAAYGMLPPAPIWFGTEVLAGLALGFALRGFVFALQTAGAMIAQATSLSQMFGGVAAEPSPALGTLMLMAGFALAFAMDLPAKLAQALILSYDAVPPGTLLPTGLMADWALARASHAVALAFSLAAPFVIASLLANVALGVMNRAMPQLMVSFVGAPAMAGGALALAMIALPGILAIWWGGFSALLADPFAMPK